MRDTACTLYEGNYHLGVGALINSLYAHGFRGQFFVGYRGELPPWVAEAKSGIFLAAPGLTIQFIHLETPWHLANYKAKFMADLFARYPNEINQLAYFDPDIVVTCRWSFYREWINGGIAVVQEVTNGTMPSTHPLRLAWSHFLTANGETARRDLERYFNSGFVGIAYANRDFLLLWHKLHEAVLSSRKEAASQFMPGDRSLPFFGIDQDCLNAALMSTEQCICVIGPEGMGFIPGGFTMQHAVGSPKPWQFSLWKSIARASPPSMAIKAFWMNVENPIKLFGSLEILRARIGLAAATFIGRFYCRN
jgi:hypothetical protein